MQLSGAWAGMMHEKDYDGNQITLATFCFFSNIS